MIDIDHATLDRALQTVDNMLFELIEEMWDRAPMCEHSQHLTHHVPDDPAKYLVRVLYPCCHRPPKLLQICETAWRWYQRQDLLHCLHCGSYSEPADNYWELVQVL